MVGCSEPSTEYISNMSGIFRYFQVKAKDEGSDNDICYSDVQVIRKVGLPPASIPAATSKRLREPQNSSNLVYTDQQGFKIGKYALEHTNKKAVDKFSEDFSRPIPESTVRNFKAFLKAESA